jgi:2-oxoglutarate/2-oxoacid ferredoxin oxidoreductase subunit beta
VNPFPPLSIALSAGANFIARGFSGDPNGVARLIVEGVRHPGFSLVQVLSPCVTYRVEQRGWKDAVRPGFEATDDPVQAGRRVLEDDGFNLGVLFKGNWPVYKPFQSAKKSMTEVEKQFFL